MPRQTALLMERPDPFRLNAGILPPFAIPYGGAVAKFRGEAAVSLGFASPLNWLQANFLLASPPDWLRARLVPAEGFEPPTFGLQNRCTTTVLSRRALNSAPLLQMMPNVQPSV